MVTANGARRTLLTATRRLLAVVLIVLPLACKTNQRYDLIEAELRTRDNELRDTRSALDQSRVLNRAYEQQLQGAQHYPPGSGVTARGTLAPGVFVKDLSLGRGTGGYDEDNCPGDEALMVVLVPRDEDGSPVKVPARVAVAAWQVDPQGMKTQIGNWDLPPDRVRPSWKSGLFSTGYFLVLPWQTFPSSDRVRVAARLTTLDGRTFEADRDVSVRLMQPQRREGPSVGTTALPPPVYELPPPEGVNAPVPGYPVVPPNLGPRELLPPAIAPTGVPPTLPITKVEELPPPADLGR